MAQIINLSIDLTKIDKSKIKESNGKKWYNLQVSINDEKDKFDNDGAVWENQTKEERDAKKPKNYLGNAKVSWSSEPQKKEPEKEEDLPF